MTMIAAAMTPYVLGLFFPRMMFKNFFVAIYRDEVKDEPEVRNAEIYWKLMFAAQGLVQTILLFVEAMKERSAKQLLRDSYVAWAIFYICATLKIRWERSEPRNYLENPFFIQAWHILVTIVLLADVFIRPGVRGFVKGLFV
uniref:Uncharacterized protein n=1 Tax=Cyclophora tenuis TaxID=216820 RepID=A0A7S1GP18_CYCTE